MRALILAAAGLLFAGDALAADFLRGSTMEEPPATGYRWAGVYVGGQYGFANADFGFSKSAKSLVAEMVRATLVETESGISDLLSLPNKNARGGSYGGFIGYSSQWGDVVLSIEGNYNRTSISATSTNVIGRSFTTSDQYRNDVVLSATASATLTDYGTLRARAGYAAGWFMPYVTGGLAIGRVNYSRSATIALTQTDVSPSALDQTDGIAPRPPGALDDTRTDARNGAVAIGYSVGVGVDVGLFPGVFVRGEYEFVQLSAIAGIPIHASTFRAGAGVKF